MSRFAHNARLKVKRANSHLDEITRDSAPLSKKLYEITNGAGYSLAVLAKPDGFYLTYRPKEPISEHFGPIIGDIVNNLREAMDYWVNEAVARVSGTRRKLHFPFSSEWKNLVTSPHYPAVEKAFPDLAVFIAKEIKPCRDTNLDLWAASSLCNQNKHNDFVPVTIVTSVSNINAQFGTSALKHCGIGGNADRPIRMIRSSTPITIQDNFDTTVEITFPGGAVFEGQPVIPTLLNMSQAVSEALDTLDAFVAAYIK